MIRPKGRGVTRGWCIEPSVWSWAPELSLLQMNRLLIWRRLKVSFPRCLWKLSRLKLLRPCWQCKHSFMTNIFQKFGHEHNCRNKHFWLTCFAHRLSLGNREYLHLNMRHVEPGNYLIKAGFNFMIPCSLSQYPDHAAYIKIIHTHQFQLCRRYAFSVWTHGRVTEDKLPNPPSPVLRFSLNRGMPLDPWNPYSFLMVILAEKVPIFSNFSWNVSPFFTNFGKMDPCLAIFLKKIRIHV